MEVLRVGLDCFVSPLQSSCQEPRESEDDPPNARRHAEKIENHEEHGAQFMFGTLSDCRSHLYSDTHRRWERFPTRYRIARCPADHISQCDHQVTDGQENNRPLGIPAKEVNV